MSELILVTASAAEPINRGSRTAELLRSKGWIVSEPVTSMEDIDRFNAMHPPQLGHVATQAEVSLVDVPDVLISPVVH